MATKMSIAYATPPQKEQCVSGILSAVGDGARMALEELSSTNSVRTPEEFQSMVISKQAELNKLVRESVKEIVMEKISDMMLKTVGHALLPVFIDKEIEIPETDGSEILAHSDSLFRHIDYDSLFWDLNVTGKPTGKTKVEIFDVVRSANFKTMFNIPGRSLDSLCFEQAQIKAFVIYHRNYLQKDHAGNFFLFKVKFDEGDKYFVADPTFKGPNLYLKVLSYDDPRELGTQMEHRVIIPKVEV